MSNLFQINRKVRDSVILGLRRIFTNDPKYPYAETSTGEFDFDRTKLIICDVIPQEHAFFPAILVNTVSGTEERYIGPDTLLETKDIALITDSDKKFASITLAVNINVITIDDTIARDELIDRIYDHFKLITDDLADNGIEIIKSNFNADSRTFINDRWFITASITLDVYTEWVDDVGPGQHVTKIPIQTNIQLP